MFCRNCGAEIDENAFVCPKCGVRTSVTKSVAVEDAPNIGFAFLGFFFPVIGLILWLLWKDTTPLKAKSCGKGALASAIVSVVVGILYGIIVAVMLSGFMYY